MYPEQEHLPDSIPRKESVRDRNLEESGAPVQTSIRVYLQYIHKTECLSDVRKVALVGPF